MKNILQLLTITIALSLTFIKYTSAQSIPTVAEVHNFLNNSLIQLTYRKGGSLYGTNFLIKIHYCPTGTYGLYGNSQKQTVLDNIQNNNWREFGNWKVVQYNGNVGVYSRTTTATENFVPVYRLPNGNLTIGGGTTIVRKGRATCN